MLGKRLINTKVAGGGGCTDIVDNYDPFGGNGVALYQLNGNLTEVSGNYTATQYGNISYIDGVFGQGLSTTLLNDSNYVDLGLQVALPQSNDLWTISVWFKAESGTDSIIFGSSGAATYGRFVPCLFYISSTNKVITQNWNYGGLPSSPNYTSNASVSLGWNLATLIKTNVNTFSLYINGVFDGSFTTNSSGAFTSNSNLALGLWFQGLYGGSNSFSDQVRIFNTALTPLEVEALYTEELCICDGTVDTLDILGDGSCIATYQLDGNANDLSGNYSGTPTDVSYGVGEFDLAGVFNGSSSVIDIPANIIPTNFVASISVWVKGVSLANSGSSDIIFQNANGGPFFALITQSNVLELFTRNSSATNYRPFQYSLSNFNTTDWYHICVTFSGLSNAVNLYVNGVNVDSGSLQSTSISYTFANNIGNESGNTIGWNGSIDQVRIFNKALSAGEVTTLYNETACTPAPLDPCVDVFSDESGLALYQLNGTAFDLDRKYDGTANDVTYAAGQFNQAAVFNGSSSYIKASNSLYTGLPLADYSVSAWFKINAYGDQFPTIFASHTGGITLPPYLWISASILRLHGYTYNDYTNTLSTGVWYNVIMVNSGTNTELYLNGAIQTPTSRNIYTTTTGQFFDLGGVDQYPTTTSFDGSIDQVRIFNKALSQSEVTTLYTSDAACG